ncbi:MAG: nucleotidyltransferase domain-containing protein, partial [Patescibacteria group bacterium]|nr:nucleotidyltransferase domain-containing protein [Patescibacteria group bacterium]
LISGELGLNDLFGRKYDSLAGQEKEAVDSAINFSEQYGNLATMYAQGMARRTTPERVRKLLEDVYKDKLQDVRFALLYGSRKEFSDIDVFMVGNGAPNEAHSDWLDVKYKSHKEFKKGLENFDVRILTPLMNGKLIFGERGYFEKSKQQVLSQPITEEAIRHNLKWSSRMQRLRNENLENDFLRNKFEGYSQTYLANALALREDLRLFSKEDLLSYSQQEKFIELKGGTEKNAT